MQLPSRLSTTTLGDVLGALHREAVTGVLELTTDSGAVHRVHLRDGFVAFVEAPAGRRLGDILRESRPVSPGFSVALERCAFGEGALLGQRLTDARLVDSADVRAALRLQVRERLEWLFGVPDAQLRFRVVTARERSAPIPPLLVDEFLHGRRRRRPASSVWSAPSHQDPRRRAACELLGIPPGAASDQIRAAFRRRALSLHPDRHGHVDERERQRLNDELVRLNDAYRTLVA